MNTHGRRILIFVAIFGSGFVAGYVAQQKRNAAHTQVEGAATPAVTSVSMTEKSDFSPTTAARISDDTAMGTKVKEGERLRQWAEARIRVSDAHLRDSESRRARTLREANRIRREIEIFGKHYGIDPTELRMIADLSAETMIARLAVAGDLRQEADAAGRDDIDEDRYKAAAGELDAKLAQSLTVILGEDTYQRFAAFGAKRREWLMVDRFADFTVDHGHSLSLSQREQIVDVLKHAHGKISERSASEPIKQLLDVTSANLLDQFVTQAEQVERVDLEDELDKKRYPSPK